MKFYVPRTGSPFLHGGGGEGWGLVMRTDQLEDTYSKIYTSIQTDIETLQSYTRATPKKDRHGRTKEEWKESGSNQEKKREKTAERMYRSKA